MGQKQDKIALVTGARRGIGQEIAREFVKEQLLHFYNSSEAPALALEAELQQLGVQAKAIK